LIGLLSGPGVILPGDTEVQGNLTVDGTTDATGLLFAHADLEVGGNAALVGFLNVSGLLTARGGFTVNASAQGITLPAQSLAQAALAQGAALQAVWLGTANTTKTALGVPPAVALNTLALDAREDVTRYELVIAQVTTEIAAVGNPSFTVTWTLRRGTTDMQSRILTYSSTSTQATTIDIPLTMVRLQPITAPTAQAWSLMGSATPISGGSVYHTFSQLSALQFS
jgi:hypothetical protein